jgi:hypothetical protein
MAEQPDPTQATDGSRAVDDVLGRYIGNEEHPAEGRVDEAQRDPQAGRSDDTHPGRPESATRDYDH